MRALNLLLGVGLFFILLTTTGCIPGITWLPDSSGFIYTTEKRGLIHLDLAKRKPRTLVEDSGTGTVWPAVSPDGKQVAVAGLVHQKSKPDILQIIIYDMNGKEIRRSPPFVYTEAGVANKNENSGALSLFWSPLNNQIIVDACGGSGKPKCAIYDLKANRISFLPGMHPSAFGGNPIRPDGKGFLVAKEGDKGVAGMSFIDRDGKEHAIAMKTQALDSEDGLDILELPFFFTSFWQGNKAVVFDSKGRFEIDTDRFVLKYTSFPQAQADKGKEILHELAFPNNSKIVRVLEITNQRSEKAYRLEILDSREKKPKTLIKTSNSIIMFPSPNQKLVAVRCGAETEEGKTSDLILVINYDGEIVTRITADK